MTADNATSRPVELAPDSLDPSVVETFLTEHPAFFKHRPELLMALELPHGGAGAVSLVERQVNLLRERNIEMRTRLAAMTQNAETNDALFESTRNMVLDLLDCSNAAALPGTVERSFGKYFDVEFGTQLWLQGAGECIADAPELDADRANVVAGLLKGGNAFCGIFRADEMRALFPTCQSEGSAAIAPLMRQNTLVGALAVGSSDPHRYDSSVGTLFLQHLAEVIVRLPFVRANPTL